MSRAFVIMGASGCGKSTLGRALADALGSPFVEGDTLHPAANTARMAAGVPLNDADRRPFLEHVAGVIAARGCAGIVVSCSALKRSYRDLIRAQAGKVTFVLPEVPREVLFSRLARRRNHFMPASLLDSQLATLERPEPSEQAISLDGTATTDAQVAQVLAALRDPGNPK